MATIPNYDQSSSNMNPDWLASSSELRTDASLDVADTKTPPHHTPYHEDVRRPPHAWQLRFILSSAIALITAWYFFRESAFATQVDQLKEATDQIKSGRDLAELRKIQHTPVTFIESMKSLSDDAILKPVDFLSLRESSGVLKTCTDLSESSATVSLLTKVLDNVDLVSDMMRQLNGKGQTELEIFMREFIFWFNRQEATSDMQSAKRILDRHRDSLSILSRSISNILDTIHITNKANKDARYHLHVMERKLIQSSRFSRITDAFGSTRSQALNLNLQSIRGILSQTHEISTFLNDTRPLLKLYQDNLHSWLNVIVERMKNSKTAHEVNMQCLILLDAIRSHVGHIASGPPSQQIALGRVLADQ